MKEVLHPLRNPDLAWTEEIPVPTVAFDISLREFGMCVDFDIEKFSRLLSEKKVPARRVRSLNVNVTSHDKPFTTNMEYSHKDNTLSIYGIGQISYDPNQLEPKSNADEIKQIDVINTEFGEMIAGIGDRGKYLALDLTRATVSPLAHCIVISGLAMGATGADHAKEVLIGGIAAEFIGETSTGAYSLIFGDFYQGLKNKAVKIGFELGNKTSDIITVNKGRR